MATPFRKDAARFIQTQRTGWVLTMTVREITQILPPRPPEQRTLFTDTNRPITGRHLDSIERFLANTPHWAMPAITLAALPGRIQQKDAAIEVDPEDLSILDGQHRTQAFSNLIHEWQTAHNQEELADRLKALEAQELPVVIFEVESNRDQRQMFAWFARNKPIEPTVREYFDQSDPFGTAAKAAMEDSKVLDGQVTYQVRTVPPKDRELMSLSNLKEIASVIQIGIRRAPKAEDRAACSQEDNQEALQKRLVTFFDEFLPKCLPNYELLTEPAHIRTKILQERSRSYAVNPMVIRLVANVWARRTDGQDAPPTDQLALYVGEMKLRRADPTNDLEDKFAIITNPRKKFPGLRDKVWEEATTKILEEARDTG